MKKQFKPLVIANAFLKTLNGFKGDDTISPDEIEYRRDKCSKCNYNSNNTEKNKLNALQELYGKIGGNFCTICMCKINEKTQTATEECALSERNRKPLWFRTAALTRRGFDDLISLSPRTVNIDSDSSQFYVFIEDLDCDKEVGLILKSEVSILFPTITRSCVSCTELLEHESSNNILTFKFKMKYSELKYGVFTKYIYIKYKTISDEERNVTICIKGNKI